MPPKQWPMKTIGRCGQSFHTSVSSVIDLLGWKHLTSLACFRNCSRLSATSVRLLEIVSPPSHCDSYAKRMILELGTARGSISSAWSQFLLVSDAVHVVSGFAPTPWTATILWSRSVRRYILDCSLRTRPICGLSRSATGS